MSASPIAFYLYIPTHAFAVVMGSFIWNFTDGNRNAYKDEFRFETCPDDSDDIFEDFKDSDGILISLLTVKELSTYQSWFEVLFRLTAVHFWLSSAAP